ncbi:MAG: SDR family oxidoreductase [Chloroflexi bacterium]|nr:SDR family oxidoreductase [Chloroflexota bacterium]MCL5273352.1 SDR family oxidoreductase [Chloroflexota bacterium]
MDIRLDNRVALITGAGEGIGRGCALALAEAGAAVVVNDVNPQTGQATAEQIRQMGRRSLFVQADVSDARVVQAMFETVQQEFGALHVLLNNAGFNLFKTLEQTTLEEWDRIMSVDLRGIYLVTRAMLPLLKVTRGASVINIASVHAQATVAGITAYAAAKGGVVSVGRSLAQELGKSGIRVNTISPGFVSTPLLDRWLNSEPDPPASLARVQGFHPLGRIGAPQDIGNLVVFLASDYAGFISGANITIDGGLTARLMH